MRSTSLMIRFLDLTLILLAFFLMRVDLATEYSVSMPRGSAEGESDFEVLEIVVTMEDAVVQSLGGSQVCFASDNEQLEACLLSLPADVAMPVLMGNDFVDVQRLVDILDVCTRAGQNCVLTSTG